MKNRRRIIVLILIIILAEINFLIAGEKEIIDLAGFYNENGEYYNAVTESMRYQLLFPEGVYNGESMLIMGEAYRRGGNYSGAINTFAQCYERYRNRPEGEKALYLLGYTRLTTGSPYFAYRSFQEYQYIYKDGNFSEDISYDLFITLILLKDLGYAKKAAVDYQNKFSNGKYLKEVQELRQLIDDEINRPKKSVWVSVIGSVFIPGFGHFYAGQNSVGIFSLVSNALCIYLFYDGYRDRDKMRMIVFGLAELSFYNYSLYSAARNVYEYNENSDFYKRINFRLNKKF